MSELQDAVNEAVEKGQESKLNTIIAISVAITATFVAVCNVKDGNIVQAMQQAQASAVDEWAYYQAKGTKLNIAESALDELRIQREVATWQAAPSRVVTELLDRKIAEYGDKIRLYEQEKVEIKRTAEGFQKEYDRLNLHDDQFDMAEATISVAIALFGITALTQKRRLLYVALTFAGFGIIMGLAGFFGLALHPDFLARVLS